MFAPAIFTQKKHWEQDVNVLSVLLAYISLFLWCVHQDRDKAIGNNS